MGIMTERILFLEMKEEWQREHITENLRDAGQLILESGKLSDLKVPPGDMTILSPFINTPVRAKEFDAFPKLRLIATRSTGFDHIDVAEAAKRGILVANVPTYGENTVAEHTFALILSLSRNLRRAYFKSKQGDFTLDGLMGFDLKGKTLGVIGTGRIGLHVIHMARGFGLEVLAYDVRQDHFMEEVLGFKYRGFDELLEKSDILSLHVPYLPSTHHLVNLGNIGKIKRGAILINTSRGGLIETAALVKALDEGVLAGAGLDVLEGESCLLEEKRFLDAAKCSDCLGKKPQVILEDKLLLARDNVIFTPHMAFYSKEAVTRILDTTAENILNFLAGKPAHIVNVPKPS